MSDPISRAQADLAQKEQEIARLQGEADKLRVFIEMYRSYADTTKPVVVIDHINKSKKNIIADAAISIIKRHRKPVPLGVLYTEIEASGVDVGTSDPRQYLSTTLNRDERFVSIKGEGWALAD